MKLLRRLLALLGAFSATGSAATASSIAYPFRCTDNSGNLIAGATVKVGATTLTAGTPASVTAQALGSTASLTCTVTYYDRSNGDYVLLYDPVAGGEAYIPLTISKSGSTITNGNALIGMTCAQDSGIILGHIGRINTAQGGTSTTITLDAGASATDNAYTAHFIKIVANTGSGQFATITAYNGTTKVATISRPAGSWTITPDSTSIFEIEATPASQVFSNLDKTNMVLATSEHTLISGTDVPAALNTAQPGSPVAGSPFAHIAAADSQSATAATQSTTAAMQATTAATQSTSAATSAATAATQATSANTHAAAVDTRLPATPAAKSDVHVTVVSPQ